MAKYYPSDANRAFYEEAIASIQEWLLDEEKSVIREESRMRGDDYDSMELEEKFFALLNYLDVRYVRLPNRIAEINKARVLVKTRENLESSEVEPVQFDIPNSLGEYLPLSDISQKVLSQSHLQGAFQEMLQSIGVSEGYFDFLLKRRSNHLVF